MPKKEFTIKEDQIVIDAIKEVAYKQRISAGEVIRQLIASDENIQREVIRQKKIAKQLQK